MSKGGWNNELNDPANDALEDIGGRGKDAADVVTEHCACVLLLL